MLNRQVPSALAQSLGMPSSLTVDVRLKKGVPSASRVDIEPLSPDDWEVLELHAGHVEEQLLNQARVVSTSCILPVWIMRSSLIRFNIISCHSSSGPCMSVLLAPSTEVVVAPKRRALNAPAPAPAVMASPHTTSLRVLPAEWLHSLHTDSDDPLPHAHGDSRCLNHSHLPHLLSFILLMGISFFILLVLNHKAHTGGRAVERACPSCI